MPTTWPDDVDRVVGGDMTAALAYVTPAGGAVVTAVAPIGLRDRERGTIGFTTSLGFGKKLERIRRNPRVTLAYHARKHGFADGTRYVMVQGDAELTLEPDRELLENDIGPRAERWLGPRKSGPFWDRWLQEYYADRVVVTVAVERIVKWPDRSCSGEPEVFGAARPTTPPPSQSPPAKGTAPRIRADRAARRLRRTAHLLLAFADSDGFPFVVPVEVTGAGSEGIRIAASEGLLPAGARRAGLLGHDYRAQLTGLTARQYTGWLEVAHPDGRQGLYAPHTERGFRAPANKTLLLLANGLLAKRGLRRARRAGR
jgi:general stress protein 26